MSQNNPTTIYAGLDVAKATLQLSLLGLGHALDNEPKGHTRLIALLRKAEAKSGAKVHVVLEATGGYEKAAVRALHAAGLALSVLLPSRVRAFAHAQGKLAKTDPIDADLLAAFGQAIRPAPSAPPTAAQLRLDELVGRRMQLLETRVAEQNRAAHYTQKELAAQSRRLLAALAKQIAQCDRLIAAQIAADSKMALRVARLQQEPGVGVVTAAVLLAEMPELGTLNDGESRRARGPGALQSRQRSVRRPAPHPRRGAPRCVARSTWRR